MVETLHHAIGIDRALALGVPPVVCPYGSDSPVGQVLVDALVGDVSHEDPLPSDTEGQEPSTGFVQRRTRTASKRRLSWLDSPQVESIEANSLGHVF